MNEWTHGYIDEDQAVHNQRYLCWNENWNRHLIGFKTRNASGRIYWMDADSRREITSPDCIKVLEAPEIVL